MSMFLTILSAAWLSQAAGAAPQQPAPVAEILRCRSLPDAERLRCFDQAANALQTAVSGGGLVVVDREEVQRTRRSLFGLRVEDIPFLRRNGVEQPASIEGVIRSARQVEYDKWQVVLADGAVWQTTEADSRTIAPRNGDSVTIRRGPLGSFIMQWKNGRPQRVRRVS